MRLGDLLVKSGDINRGQLAEALRRQAAGGARLGTCLLDLGFLDERVLASALAKQLSAPAVTEAQLERVPSELVWLLPPEAAARLRAMPVRKDGGKMWVATVDPRDQSTLDQLERLLGCPVRAMVAPERSLARALRSLYGVEMRAPGGAQILAPPAVVAPAPPPRPAPAVAAHDHGGPPPVSLPGFGPPPVAPPGFGPPPVAAPLAAPALVELDQATLDARPAPRGAPTANWIEPSALGPRLAEAPATDAVLELALAYLCQSFRRAHVFLARDGVLSAYRGRGTDPARVTGARIATGELDVVVRAAKSGEALVGYFTPDLLGRLAAPLGLVSSTIGALVPLRVDGRAIGFIVALDGDAAAERSGEALNRLARKLDQALHILELRRRLVAD